MLFGTTHFVERVFDHDQHFITPLLSLPIILVSLFMLLYGTGQWGRWRYLSVFVLLPVSFIVPVWIYWLLAGIIVPMPIPFITMGIVGILAHASVKRHYTRREQVIMEKNAG